MLAKDVHVETSWIHNGVCLSFFLILYRMGGATEEGGPAEAVLPFGQTLGCATHADVTLTSKFLLQRFGRWFEVPNRKGLRINMASKFLRSQRTKEKSPNTMTAGHQSDKHSGLAKQVSSGLRCFPPLSSLWHSLSSWCLSCSCEGMRVSLS